LWERKGESERERKRRERESLWKLDLSPPSFSPYPSSPISLQLGHNKINFFL
jgi:hypothetical protein